jgi:hypothetical protein
MIISWPLSADVCKIVVPANASGSYAEPLLSFSELDMVLEKAKKDRSSDGTTCTLLSAVISDRGMWQTRLWQRGMPGESTRQNMLSLELLHNGL